MLALYQCGFHPTENLQVIDLKTYFYHLKAWISIHKSRTYTTHQGLRAVFAQSFTQSYPQAGKKANGVIKLRHPMK